MSNKIGYVVSHGCYGGKGIQRPSGLRHNAIALPDCLKDVPVGFIAYIDHEGKLSFMDEDPHDYEDRD